MASFPRDANSESSPRTCCYKLLSEDFCLSLLCFLPPFVKCLLLIHFTSLGVVNSSYFYLLVSLAPPSLSLPHLSSVQVVGTSLDFARLTAVAGSAGASVPAELPLPPCASSHPLQLAPESLFAHSSMYGGAFPKRGVRKQDDSEVRCSEWQSQGADHLPWHRFIRLK